MKIAIIDDEQIFCSMMKNMISNEYPNMEIHVFYDGVSYLNANETYDITILDIQMPEIDGIEVSKQIEHKSKLIIFVTSMEERMQEAFGINVYAFVLKNQVDTKLLLVINDAISSLNNTLLDFSTASEDIFVYLDDIYYIQIENRKNYLYTKKKAYKIVKRPLLEIFQRLNHDFVYVSQSCVVNLNHIKIRHNEWIKMDNEQILSISKKYRKAFKLNYMRRMLYD